MRLNSIRIQKILRKNQNVFPGKSIHNFADSDYLSNYQKRPSKIYIYSRQHYCLDISPRHLTPYARKKEQMQIRLAYDLSAKMIQWFARPIVTATFFCIIVTIILQGDTLAPYLLIIYLDYIPGMTIDLIKENSLTLKRQEADDILQKLTYGNYAVDQTLFVNTSTLDESKLEKTSKWHWSLRESRQNRDRVF